jgi:hypothetical protein
MELGQLLQLIAQWLHHDTAALDRSLTRFLGTPGYPLQELDTDVTRYAFLLGGNDGEHLLDPWPNPPGRDPDPGANPGRAQGHDRYLPVTTRGRGLPGARNGRHPAPGRSGRRSAKLTPPPSGEFR